MPDVVLDASLALRWVLPDERTASADRVLNQWETGNLQIVVPPLFWAELVNGLFQAYRRQRIQWGEAEEGFRLFATRHIRVSDLDTQAYGRTLQMAHQLSPNAAYDLVYLALAQSLGIEFRHSDRRLDTSLGNQFPWARYIG